MNAGIAQESNPQVVEYNEKIRTRLERALRLVGKGSAMLHLVLNQAGEVKSQDVFNSDAQNQKMISEAVMACQPFGVFPVANWGLLKFKIDIVWSKSRGRQHQKVGIFLLHDE
jgi:hypothetical protein